MAPASRMRSMISGDFTRGSAHRIGRPVSAYGGRAMCSGTDRIGLTTPGTTRPASGLWQRLYLRPLPHQQRSFDRRLVADMLMVDHRLRPAEADPARVLWSRPTRRSADRPVVRSSSRSGSAEVW